MAPNSLQRTPSTTDSSRDYNLQEAYAGDLLSPETIRPADYQVHKASNTKVAVTFAPSPWERAMAKQRAAAAAALAAKAAEYERRDRAMKAAGAYAAEIGATAAVRAAFISASKNRRGNNSAAAVEGGLITRSARAIRIHDSGQLLAAVSEASASASPSSGGVSGPLSFLQLRSPHIGPECMRRSFDYCTSSNSRARTFDIPFMGKFTMSMNNGA